MNNKVLFALVTVLFAVPAFAQTAGAITVPEVVGSSLGLVTIGVGIMMGLAVLGGTMGQGRAAAAALEGMARNPAASDKLFTPLIISLALMESLVLFAFLIGILLESKIGQVLDLVK
jgi:F-type H+-transporting ATPase subunit c